MIDGRINHFYSQLADFGNVIDIHLFSQQSFLVEHDSPKVVYLGWFDFLDINSRFYSLNLIELISKFLTENSI